MRYNLVIAIIILLNSLLAYSNDLTAQRVQVIYKIAKESNVDSNDLIRIAYIESRFNINTIRLNKNKTVDFGMFQINSVHWSTTCKHLNVMAFSGNVKCAAILLKQAESHSSNDKHWIGRYHSKTPSKKVIYFKLLQTMPKRVLASIED